MQIAAMSQVSFPRPASTQITLHKIPQRVISNKIAETKGKVMSVGSFKDGSLSALATNLVSRSIDISADLYQFFYSALLSLDSNFAQAHCMTGDSFKLFLYELVEGIFHGLQLNKSNIVRPLKDQSYSQIVEKKDRYYTNNNSTYINESNNVSNLQAIPSRI